MACSLLNKTDGTIAAIEMLDGQMGVVREWPCCSRLVGRVVQRYGDAFIILGARRGLCFSTGRGGGGCSARIQLLSPGNTIRIDSIEIEE